jgi:chromosomal replication initiator protein
VRPPASPARHRRGTSSRPPDFATRIAILRKRAALDEIHIADIRVLELIAERVTDNIRTLEGALIRIVAHQSLTNRPLDLALAADVLEGIHPALPNDTPSIGEIQTAVASYYEISVDDLVSASRAARVAWPRQVAIHLARELTDASLQDIGGAFGGRNHATVLHACKRVSERAGSAPESSTELRELTQQLRDRNADRGC